MAGIGDGYNNNSTVEDVEPSTQYKSNFNETFAKFKKSYLSNKPAAVGKSKLSACTTPVSPFTSSKLKIARPSPFQNLLKLSGKQPEDIKIEPVVTPVENLKVRTHFLFICVMQSDRNSSKTDTFH